MNLEEELQESSIGYLLGIENDFDRLGMSLVIAIRCVRHVTTRVSDAGGNHTWVSTQKILHAPKAAPGKNCTFIR